ncbi:hypothetical protein ABFA07_022123 [Porites harrisoni]
MQGRFQKMATLLNVESSLLEKIQIFNCLTTFTQLRQKGMSNQWGLLHANQPIVPQATPVPGFERLILPSQNVDQDIPASTKQAAPESMQEKSFFDDFGDVNDIFDGPTESSEFNFNPEKDIDQVPDRTDFDVFLDEVLGIQDLYGSSRSPYEFWQSQPNYLLYGQPNGCFDSQTNNPINIHDSFYNPSTTVPVQDEPSDPLQSQHDPPNSLFHSQPNSPYQSQTDSPSYSQPNSPMDNLSSPSHVNPAQSLFPSQSSSPYQSQSNSSPLSQPNSPMDNLNSPSHVNPAQSLFPSQSSSPYQSQSNSSPLSQPNSPMDNLNSPSHTPSKSLFQSQSTESSDPYQSQTNSPPLSQPNSPVDSHLNSQSHSPAQSLFQSQSSPLYSPPSSPVDSHLSNPSVSPPHSPGSLSASETSSNMYSTDEGIGSQSDMSECDDDVLELSMSPEVSSPIPEPTNHELLSFVKQDPDLLSAKPGRRKRGPRPQVKYRGDGPMQLWQFLLELLIAPEYSKLVKWTLDEDYEFKILKPSQVARMWGDKKNKPTMNYEKLSRGLRYYYGKSVIEKVHGKRYVYQFKCDIPKILGYDPMASVKGEESVEDSVCGEPIMSPAAEDLLVTPSAEGGLLAFL